MTLRLPSLEERPEDIPLLADHFLSRLAPRYGRDKAAFAPEALELLVKAKWPGNVRQLYNVVEQSIALCPTEIIPQAFVDQAIQVEMHEMTSFEDARKRFERDYLTRILKLTKGSVTQAAKLARRNRTEFYAAAASRHRGSRSSNPSSQVVVVARGRFHTANQSVARPTAVALATIAAEGTCSDRFRG